MPDHQYPGHNEIYDACGQRTHSQHRVPIPLAFPPTLHHSVWGVVRVTLGRFDDVGGDPHLYGAAAACRCADDGPANERANFMVEKSEGELRGGPTYCYDALALLLY